MTDFNKQIWLGGVATLVLLLSFIDQAYTCSRVLWNDNQQAVVVGRSMDWFEDMKSNLWAFPRGMLRDGGAGKNSLKWTSKYGSLVATGYEMITVDGINEKGFAVNPLWLAESDYGKRDESIPGISFSIATQYFLDNFATVAEAVRFIETEPFQIVTGPMGSTNRQAAGHVALADLTGDSAVVEWIDGKPIIYHSRKYTVMTNSPPINKQLANLKQYKAFGGTKELPGSEQSADRFVRAARYLESLPEPANKRETIAYLMSVMRNISAPFGVADSLRPNISTTRWRIVADLTNKVYYFESTTSPNVIWVSLDKLSLRDGNPILMLDLVNDSDRTGDVSGQFRESTPFDFKKKK
ncbi:MAG: linear amide C-N hydrolase [Bacteroidales bacterium]|jgi:choloylglycine hydrolase|nr:linear amide C-N hydrolase [Bacteroidales bacterium]